MTHAKERAGRIYTSKENTGTQAWTKMSNAFLAFFRNGYDVHDCLHGVFDANSPGVYYYEVLLRSPQHDECCCLIVHRKGHASRCALWDMLLASMKFSDIRRIAGLSVLQSLKYLRMLLKLWRESVLHTSHAPEDVADELRECAPENTRDCLERMRVFRSVELIGILHASVVKDTEVLPHERVAAADDVAVDVDPDSGTDAETGGESCVLYKSCEGAEPRDEAIQKLRGIGRSMRRGSLPEAYMSAFMSRNVPW
jgi:hypothetical protein